MKQVDLFVCSVAAKAEHEMLVSIINTGYDHNSFILSVMLEKTWQENVLDKYLHDKLV